MWQSDVGTGMGRRVERDMLEEELGWLLRSGLRKNQKLEM